MVDHPIACRTCMLPVFAGLAIALAAPGLGAAPVPEGSGIPRSPQAVAAPGFVDWLDFILMTHTLESVLTEEASLPNSLLGSQGEAVALSLAQSDRFRASGVKGSLSPSDAVQGEADISAVRWVILNHPEEFTDPAWDSYLSTLDDLTSKLSTV